MTNLFGGIFNEITTDVKKAVDASRNILQVPVFSGLNIKNWFKSSSILQNPFAKFSFRFVEGRVPFDQFERDFLPKVPNLFPSANSIGFDDAISIFENLFDQLSEDEEEEYQNIRYQVHYVLLTLKNLVDESQIIQILEDYSELDTLVIKDFYFGWLARTDDSNASVRDQLIDLVSSINMTIQALVIIKLSVDRRNATIIASETMALQDIVIQIEQLLNNYADELESLVERLSSLIEYERTTRVQRSRVQQISQFINNPLFAFVRSDFIKAQLTSISPLATSFANKGEDVRNQVNAAQSSVGQNARLATSDVGGGDKIQQEQQTETIPANGCVGPLDENDWAKLRGWLFQRESSRNYSSVNRYGYCGGYQMGGGALVDLGYAKPGTKTSSLAVDSNWTGRNGIDSRDTFLSNGSKQDGIVLEYTRLNYKRLLRAGTVTTEDSKATVAGYLAVAHLLGSGGARDYKNGRDGADANGTTASVYFKGGSGALGGALPDTASSAQENKTAAESNTLQDEAQISVPSSGGATVYGYNRVRHFESGHFEEFDNTPGSERIQVRHKTGTGYEYQADGTAVFFAKGDSYQAVAGNNYIIVEGVCNIYVKGNAGIVADGDVNVNASNDINMLAGGDFNVRVGGKYSLQVDGSSNENIKGDSARLVGGFSRQSTDGDTQIESASMSIVAKEGNFNMLSFADFNIVTTANYNLTASGDTSSVAKGKSITVSYGDQAIVASGKMTINGSDLVAHGTSSAKYSSAGQTTVAGGGTIKLSHPVEKAMYSDTAGLAVPGTPVPVPPSGSASDGGGGQVRTDNEKRPEKKKTEKIIEQYTAQNFDQTMAYSGGGEGREPSKVDPLSIA
ncbi:baseplate hub subunit and tail lysozyme protein [Rhizobium phage RHph_I46]|uniref:Baseplate hub subunit and tail lysozyme protein n=1 Tax=Rhizobium phage RHph_I1_9 TaxID=2509729 RepID=A0A7S5R9C4_9CAUD|nr:baseplate hub subunit and tail lysozyme protein [Rhizobium phage RHph_I1_9]QIG69638.1 baseplate hub subunit and tail lysozyme protein [Rhizobium phage RHph_I46]QIG70919.1 baseplate hub subunit and tail lysozyme protein [Rhizobium phage RHph_I9]QIG73505.1 baseplate hub subunit and tail lysozyme protein [Rhizobium phage RHph_I1_9]QIG76258.1 baseplate hub subunit and tail lysozyme protein [Rhizobium phage RHph_I34]